MNAVSRKYNQPTFWDTYSTTSSQASADGLTLYVSPDGPKTDQSGQEAVPVSRFLQRASRKAKKTKGISGPPSLNSYEGTTLSASENLSLRLVSRLAQRFATVGSMEYVQTWKEKVTPAGMRYWEHTAKAHRTSGSGCTGWPTPVVQYANGTPEDFLRRKRESVERGSSMGICLSDLNMVSQLTGWNTPRATDGSNGGPNQTGGALPADVALAGWPSPRANEATGDQPPPTGTEQQAKELEKYAPAGWVSPSSRDWKDTAGMATTGTNPDGSERIRLDQLPRQAIGTITTSSPAETEKPGVLNPAFVAWLMGYPEEWDSCGAMAMQSCRKQLQRSSRHS